MRNVCLAIYSVCAYVLFLGVFLYMIGFVDNIAVPKSIDSGAPVGLVEALLVNACLLAVFALQHSIMARPAFKRAWTRIIPHDIERSTYVLCASLVVALLCWQWRPLAQTVWQVDSATAALLVCGISWCGWGLVLLSTFLISHFHLFGLSQGFARLSGVTQGEAHFVTPLFYKWLRHPLYLGFIIAFWAAPHMSLGRLIFAIGATGYIFIGISFEERDMIAVFGGRYRQYQQDVGMLWPKWRGRSNSTQSQAKS